MPIDINLDGVDAWKGGAVLPPGHHLVRCTDAEEGRSSGGHPELHVTWEATAGEHAGSSIQDWVQVTDSTLGKVRQLLEACQVVVPAGTFSLSAAMIQGRSCQVLVREKPKPDGQLRAEIVAYSPVPKGSDLGADQGREFAHTGASASTSADDAPF